jgi:hypothetical protein
LENPIDKYWRKRLEKCQIVLEANNFEVFLADSHFRAKEIVLEKIIPSTCAKKISYGGSETLRKTELLEAIRNNPDLELIETLQYAGTDDEIWENCRQALLSDLFIAGTNAVTETGVLINLDMWGNRVGAIAFGPKYVVILVGRNKIVSDLESGMTRVKDYAAPLNAIRHDLDHGKMTPCVKTSYCTNCKSPDRICNTWTITEKSYPKGRIKIVLINDELGL